MTAAMEIGAHRGRSRRRSPLAVLFSVAALLIQALLPAASLAAESIGSVRVELCTPEGAKTVVIDHEGQVQKGFAGLPCHDCLGATLAVITSPDECAAVIELEHRYLLESWSHAFRKMPGNPAADPLAEGGPTS